METKYRLGYRSENDIRSIKVQHNVFGYADASVLFEQGQTKVLVSVTLQQGVPPFLKGQKVGWLAAEYAMLPAATHQRTMRESLQGKQNARNVEISRLIGRCLRSTVDLSLLGEKTIVVDCDVLQADGGTRVASITAASIALEKAIQIWLDRRIIETNIFKTRIAAVSVGIVNGKACTDLCYVEDSSAEVDFNFVVTAGGDLVEVQGTSEKNPISWNKFDELKELALSGIKEIFNQTSHNQSAGHIAQSNNPRTSNQHSQRHQAFEQKPGIFSLANRLNK